MKSKYFYILKIISIFFIGSIYVILGVLTSKILSKIICVKPNKNKFKNLLFIMMSSGLILVSIYLVRHIPGFIKNPLDGIYGFDSKQIKELNGGIILAIGILYYIGPCINKKIEILLS